MIAAHSAIGGKIESKFICITRRIFIIETHPIFIICAEFFIILLAFFDREHKEIGKAIDEKKVLDDELKEQILAAAKEFKERR